MASHRVLLLTALVTAFAATASACGSDSSEAKPTPTQDTLRGQKPVRARVQEVVDGVTIVVEIDGDAYRVRYLGLDLPSAGSEEDLRSSRQEALDFNRFVVEGRRVELVAGAVDTDLNGNVLRYVYVDGQMVNQTMITNGHATVANFPTDFRYQAEFLLAESNARNSRRGVWKTLPPAADQPTAEADQGFGGGTLPAMRPGPGPSVCDYSQSSTPMIKGNIDPNSGERRYHLPDGLFYDSTVVDESKGEKWFCTEGDALSAGWMRSHR